MHAARRTGGPPEPGRRILLGPGPSDLDPHVIRALATPLAGYFDPAVLDTMERIADLLRSVFGTKEALTLAVSGTGTAAMEACLANLLEPGDECVVGVCGFFGARLAEAAARLGAKVRTVDAPWGEIVPPGDMAMAIHDLRPKVAAIVHAETSTGVLQPVEGIGAAARQTGALFVLDCVTSVGGLPVRFDDWHVDAAFAAAQKCLSAPAGLAPVAFSERALAAIRRRSRRVASYYFDVELLEAYWRRRPPTYHHTAPASLLFALAEALEIVVAEKLPNRFQRHRTNHEALLISLRALGLEPVVPADRRLPMLNPVRVPPGVDEARVRRRLLEEHGIEIGGGLGPWAGKAWRIGLMGASCTRENVRALTHALARVLPAEGHPVPEDAEGALEQALGGER